MPAVLLVGFAGVRRTQNIWSNRSWRRDGRARRAILRPPAICPYFRTRHRLATNLWTTPRRTQVWFCRRDFSTSTTRSATMMNSEKCEKKYSLTLLASCFLILLNSGSRLYFSSERFSSAKNKRKIMDNNKGPHRSINILLHIINDIHHINIEYVYMCVCVVYSQSHSHTQTHRAFFICALLFPRILRHCLHFPS